MKTYSFPYGAGEWDAVIEVDITNKEAALLEESMKKNCYFHMSEDPTLAEIENKVIHRIFVENKKMMRKDGRLAELKKESPDMTVEELVWGELGNFHVNLPGTDA